MITNQISLEDCLSFELSPYPPSLVNEEGFLRSGTKSDLSTYFFDQRDDEPEIPLAETTLIVIDGGALLHRVIWDVGMSFKDIINKYKIYIKSSFKNFRLVSVVFDGYLLQSTKDHCHRKRQPIHAMEIIFGPETRLSC